MGAHVPSTILYVMVISAASRITCLQNSKMKMTGFDESHVRSCINVLLGQDSLAKMCLLTSTQKCEAVSRAYQASMPKLVTFSRNCFGHIHSTILKLNLGYADSAILKSKYANAPL